MKINTYSSKVIWPLLQTVGFFSHQESDCAVCQTFVIVLTLTLLEETEANVSASLRLKLAVYDVPLLAIWILQSSLLNNRDLQRKREALECI